LIWINEGEVGSVFADTFVSENEQHPEGTMKQQPAQALAAAICLPLAGIDGGDVPLAGNPAVAIWSSREARVPRYLLRHYWWAYVHPNAVKVFERQWLVNLILWGNYNRLRRAVLAEMAEALGGRTLQVACAYGDLTNHLAEDIARRGGSLDVIDVLPIQLQNLQQKLPKSAPVRLLAMDSTKLSLPDGSYDQALVFFLLHEQPSAYRQQTMSELFRVVRPGGKIIVVDYARPRSWHPLRYIWRPLLARLEPFALDLWRDEITKWLPRVSMRRLRRTTFFGGLYQKVVITR
jgi:ubiquinone/menaquinone biosynthesis C-methylase UbiE